MTVPIVKNISSGKFISHQIPTNANTIISNLWKLTTCLRVVVLVMSVPYLVPYFKYIPYPSLVKNIDKLFIDSYT